MTASTELERLREALVGDLGAAIHAGSRRLDENAARRAARQVIDGEGLPSEVAGHFDGGPVCNLVCFDADSIHSWVFDSERVQVSAGASETLDRLNRDVDRLIREVPGVHGKLFSAGGGGMLFADARADADALTAATRRWFEDQSHGLTFTVVCEPLHAADLKPGGRPVEFPRDATSTLGRFRHVDGLWGALVRAQVATRTAKESRVRPAPRLVVTKRGAVRAERCPSCGRRPPSREPVTDKSPEFWCGHCQGLRASRRFLDSQGLPITFNELAERIPRRRQYLAYVAVDGNSMGATVQSIGDFVGLRAFSEATTQIFAEAREKGEKVLASYLSDEEDAQESFLSLLSGGDEITLVLPATAAPEVALEVLKAIKDGFDRATADGGLLHAAFHDAPEILNRLRNSGAAAGVITAHATYPVRLLRRYANELQKEAKRHCAAHDQRSGLAWLQLTDSAPLTEGVERVTTATDLSIDAFDLLLAEAQVAHDEGLPSSALQALLSYYRQEEISLTALAAEDRRRVLDLLGGNFFRYQLARNESLASWWKALGTLSSAPAVAEDAGDAVAHWFRRGGGRRLEQLVDLLSLDPFPEAA